MTVRTEGFGVEVKVFHLGFVFKDLSEIDLVGEAHLSFRFHIVKLFVLDVKMTRIEVFLITKTAKIEGFIIIFCAYFARSHIVEQCREGIILVVGFINNDVFSTLVPEDTGDFASHFVKGVHQAHVPIGALFRSWR